MTRLEYEDCYFLNICSNYFYSKNLMIKHDLVAIGAEIPTINSGYSLEKELFEFICMNF